MVAIAIVAVLCAVAVPAFTKETRTSKGATEVGEVFAELVVREEQWRAENGSYLAAPACPSVPAVRGQNASACFASGQPWDRLRLRIDRRLQCSCEVVTGDTAGTTNPLGFTFASLDEPWFYIVATCDLDGRPAINTRYFVASTSAERQVQNEGK